MYKRWNLLPFKISINFKETNQNNLRLRKRAKRELVHETKYLQIEQRSVLGSAGLEILRVQY